MLQVACIDRGFTGSIVSIFLNFGDIVLRLPKTDGYGMILLPAGTASLTLAQAIAYLNGSRTTMDMVTEAMLKEFSKERGIEHLPEDIRFEHFCAFSLVRRYFSGESFDTMDLVTGSGSDTGIDGIATLVNGTLITDVDQFEDMASVSGQLDVSFLFIQAETSSSFDCGKLGKFGMGVLDFFKNTPSLPRNAQVEAAARIRKAIYDKSSKFNPANPICRIFYATTGKWVSDANLVAYGDRAVSDLKTTAIFRDVTLEPIDAETIQKYYRASRTAVPRGSALGLLMTYVPPAKR